MNLEDRYAALLPDSPMNQLSINFIRDREVKFSIFGCNEVHASLLLSQVEATDAVFL